MTKWSQYQETFNGNVLNGWSGTFGTVTASGGAMNMVINTGVGNYSGIDSGLFDLTGSYIITQLVDGGNQSLTSLEVYIIQLLIDATSKLAWYLNGNILKCTKTASSILAQVGSNLAYDSTVHKYFRIREDGGLIYWDYSTDGIKWTNQTSITNPIVITALKDEPTAGTFGTEASGTTVIIDNINIVQSNKPGNLYHAISVGDGMSRSEGAT